MSESEIISPPYPGTDASARTIYRNLIELRQWVVAAGNQINVAVGKRLIVEPAVPIREDMFLIQPVYDLFVFLTSLRRVREAWDQVVRDYENDWDVEKALTARAACIYYAAETLRRASSTHELNELREQQAKQRMHNEMIHMLGDLSDVLRAFRQSDAKDASDAAGRPEMEE